MLGEQELTATVMLPKPGHRYVFISDTHLGSKFSDANLLGKFLRVNSTPDTVFVLLGDIFDFWKLSQPQIQLRDHVLNGAHVILLPGNHDYELMVMSHICNSGVTDTVKLIFPETPVMCLHGHKADTKFGDPFNWWTRLKDLLLYRAASLFKTDFRNTSRWTRWLATRYYDSIGFYKTLFDYCRRNACHIGIVGHTHGAGVFTDAGKPAEKPVTIFNTGSWLHAPAAVFIKGGKYAFHMVTHEALQPAEDSFKDLG